ncbi:hypothetical protein E2C01_013048 [Portunus trituberculatus]|uniref:Uncharacterized protein n=1 Tax=Portunus trituberculatus TaxID=210409 RepID=A0A5B7DG85_PORTR|nr:hypothetical protein [Portunus trituberculatus]
MNILRGNLGSGASREAGWRQRHKEYYLGQNNIEHHTLPQDLNVDSLFGSMPPMKHENNLLIYYCRDPPVTAMCGVHLHSAVMLKPVCLWPAEAFEKQ